MRSVRVFKREQVGRSVARRLDFDGFFLGFGVGIKLFGEQGQPIQTTVALVENKRGEIISIDLDMIEFSPPWGCR